MSVSKLESILFIANRPLSVKKLAEICDLTVPETEEAIVKLTELYVGERGLRLVRSGNEVQMTTSPENSEMIQDYLKDETTGELTKPSLETLTIVAYRGPLTKPELEQIRGVNCSLILRNLLMRGLIEVEGDVRELGSQYRVTVDFLRFLGVGSIEELPDYEKLRSHENIVRAMEKVNLPEEANEEEKSGDVESDESGESDFAQQESPVDNCDDAANSGDEEFSDDEEEKHKEDTN